MKGKLYLKHSLISTSIKNLKTTGKGQHHNRFSSLKDINEVLLPLLEKNKCSIYSSFSEDKEFFVTNFIDCESGDHMQVRTPVEQIMTFNSRNFGQAIGSLVTYFRRYNLCMLFNISEVIEDDGNDMEIKNLEEEMFKASDKRAKDQRLFDHNHVFYHISNKDIRNKTLLNLDPKRCLNYATNVIQRSDMEKMEIQNNGKFKEVMLLKDYGENSQKYIDMLDEATDKIVSASMMTNKEIKTVKNNTFSLEDLK